MNRTRSATRIQGDDYQHLIAWRECVLLLHRHHNVIAVGIEAREAGSIDDVVLYMPAEEPDEFKQVKWAVDARMLVSTDYMLSKRGAKGRSLLGKFWDAWLTLRAEGKLDPWLALVTNRAIDSGDEALGAFDAYSETLRELANAEDGTRLGKARQRWADHLEVRAADLAPMLRRLRFVCGRGLKAEQDAAKYAMTAAGMQSHDRALLAGVGIVRSWVAESRTHIVPDDVRRAIQDHQLVASEPGALLVVEAVDSDPHRGDGDVSLDWRKHFPGDTPEARRAARNDAVWNESMAVDLDGAKARVQELGYSRVVIRARMRLPAWFAVGFKFSRAAGFLLQTTYKGRIFSSEATAAREVSVESRELLRSEREGSEGIAVAVSLSADIGTDVRAFLRSSGTEVKAVYSVEPPGGPSDQCMGGPEDAVAYAIAVRDFARRTVTEEGVRELHLFLATPSVLALMLGHRWNRVALTQLYEDLGAGAGYQPSFRLSAN